jgi:hypothetical protein|tara:strand:- start:1144 stop:1383 length:240 start_codon:yes stop_codon:yes gene_type:complete
MAITWEVKESDENGTLIEYTDGTHTCYTRMGETFTSLKTSGNLEYDDIDKWLVRNNDVILKMFAEQEDDDFKDEGVFEL